MIDLEHIARDYLRAQGFPCEFRAAATVPTSLVTVRCSPTGGSTRFHGRTLLKVQAWATTRGNACELCEEAVDALVGRDGYGGLASADENVTACAVENGPHDWPQTEIKNRERWQATVAVDYNS